MKKYSYLCGSILLLLILLIIFSKPKIDVDCFTCQNKNIRKIYFNFDKFLKDDYKAFNTSIIKNNDQTYTLYTRISNQIACNYYKYVMKRLIKSRDNDNLISILDRDFNIIHSYFDNNHINEEYTLTDIKPFTYQNSRYLIGTIETKTIEYKFSPGILRPDGKIIKIYWDNQDSDYIMEKNWIPLVHNNELMFITDHNPLKIAKIDLETGSATLLYKGEQNMFIPKIRGNTTYVPIGSNRYLGITHVMKSHVIDRTYSHFYTILDMTNDPQIEKISKSICFDGDCGIEFVLGFEETYDKDYYIVTYGVKDCSAHGLIVHKDKIWEMFV